VAAKSLVIVESPAKAKTIAGFLGADFVVESSIGHIRDLPRNAGDIPEAYKGQAWARLGVDVDNDFQPLYVVDSDKKDHIKRLKQLLEKARELYLATDEDREGESIAWHLLEVLKPKIPVKRMAFHEITPQAIRNAIREPREIDRRLVDAQEARRILDRLYGYEVSPVLWKKVMPKLSAGRVQSVATRIIVEREIERMKFVPARYSDIEGEFATAAGELLKAGLVAVNDEKIATGKDFDDQGKLAKATRLLGADEGKALATALLDCQANITRIERKPNRRSPAAPFMTSTLQQEAARKLRFSASRTMRAAQSLYESGHITYMRTDSTTLSDTALTAARALIAELYGNEYLPDQPRTYKNKVKNAQEAHEAIRPAGERFALPQEVASRVGGDEGRLYELIWKRTIASQMEDSRGETMKITLLVNVDGRRCEFAANGYTVSFPGFLRAYVEGSDDPDLELEERERPLPQVKEQEQLSGKEFQAREHETQPPARFTEASLVRRLEELGVGRPSTYASIISTIQNRGYVWKKGTALVPAFKAFAVINLLRDHFGDLVDYAFTARMEDELDLIASGKAELVPWLSRFYFGEGKGKKNDGAQGLARGLKRLVADRLGEIDARAINSLPLGKDDEGREVLVRVGRFGPYLQRGEETARLPDEVAPDELTVAKAVEILKIPSGPRELGKDPEGGLPVFVRSGRFGAYVQLGEADGKTKPKTSSLLKTMAADTLTLEDALKMLSLPRVIGVDPTDNQPVNALLGRYGPYITKGAESRSLDSEEALFTLTLPEALAILAQPKQRGRKAQSKEPLKTLGPSPSTGKEITVREGRFGLYVTDGEINASLRRGDDLENLTMERAEELIEMRRERGPVQKKKRGRKAPRAEGAAEAADKAPKAKAAKASKAPKATKVSSKGKTEAKSGAKPASGKSGSSKGGPSKPKRDSAAALGVTRVVKRRAKPRK
jgi:DNA topoisomerase-1